MKTIIGILKDFENTNEREIASLFLFTESEKLTSLLLSIRFLFLHLPSQPAWWNKCGLKNRWIHWKTLDKWHKWKWGGNERAISEYIECNKPI